MRFPHSLVCLSFVCLFLIAFLVTPATPAQQPTRTEAQNDGLAGPVRSVSTETTRTSLRWDQFGLISISCVSCDYDRDGFRTKAGQVLDGAFVGEIAQLVRDGNGQVIDRAVFDAASGQLIRHDTMGPFGVTEETAFFDGKANGRQTYAYDAYGNMTEALTIDSAGKPQGREQTKREPDGTLREESGWGADGQLSYQHTFDPETHVEHFTTFDRFGKVKLTWAVVAGKLASFWEVPESGVQYGEKFTEPDDNGDKESYACHADGQCDVSRVHCEYLDPKKRNPKSVEWRDAGGNLENAVYYDYEIDSFRNWTSRRVWVWSRDLGERELYETDARTITYWQE